MQGLSQQVAGLSPPLDEWRRFIYCESLVSGQLLGEVDHFPGEARQGAELLKVPLCFEISVSDTNVSVWNDPHDCCMTLGMHGSSSLARSVEPMYGTLDWDIRDCHCMPMLSSISCHDCSRLCCDTVQAKAVPVTLLYPQSQSPTCPSIAWSSCCSHGHSSWHPAAGPLSASTPRSIQSA